MISSTVRASSSPARQRITLPLDGVSVDAGKRAARIVVGLLLGVVDSADRVDRDFGGVD